jgi:hypothetical protein
MVEVPRGRRMRRLTSGEIARYDVLTPELAARVRIVRVPMPPGRYAGMTIGRYIFLTCEVRPGDTSWLLAHELVHVRQWHELGVVGFLYRYLAEFAHGVRTHRAWHDAYRGIEAEQEARYEARLWADRVGLGEDRGGH